MSVIPETQLLPERDEGHPLLRARAVADVTNALLAVEALPVIEKLLQLPHVEEEIWDLIGETYDRLDQLNGLSTRLLQVRGVLGFALLCHVLESATSKEGHEREDLVDRGNRYFADRYVSQTVAHVYKVPEAFNIAAGSIYRVGTTSFIIRCPLGPLGDYSGDFAAVKCVLYRYLFVPSIRDSTKDYKKKFHNATPHAPAIFDCNERFIAMQFIEGLTLAEYLANHSGAGGELTTATLTLLGHLSHALCTVLDELHANERSHLDLSTSNIIVRSGSDRDDLDLALIDFGANYIVTERVGSSAAFQRAAVYVAPEVLKKSPAGWRSDIYSLGIMLLEVASERALTEEELLPALERLWVDAPGLARTLEDMLDDQPSNRLLLFSDRELKRPYEALATRLGEELRVLNAFVTRTGSTGRVATLRGLRLFHPLAEFQAVRDIADDLDAGADASYAHFGGLARWAALSLFLWYLAAVSFICLTSADLHLYDLPAWAKTAIDLSNARFQVGHFWENLPGRLVPLTFALTAVTYYNNIFAPITTRSVKGAKARLSEAFMRSTSFGLYVAILWAMLWAPHAWPLCAGLGTMLVVGNNFFVWRLACEAVDRSEKAGFSTTTDASTRFVNDFQEWFGLMAAYSGTMTFLGVLLLTGVAKDENIYAYTVCFINVYKMYRLNCVKLAPRARGGFEQVLTTLRRCQRLPPEPA